MGPDAKAGHHIWLVWTMSRLDTNLAGLKLRNPVVVASCPATETVEGIRACAEYGAGAVVTKSISAYDPNDFPVGFRRTYVNDQGIWITSTYSRETLTMDAGKKLVSQTSQLVDIPIIASVTSLDMEFESWCRVCYAMQEAGASMVQLDLFYTPQPICLDEHREALNSLVRDLANEIRIPVAPKLNIGIPALLVRKMFSGTDIAAISLLDSIRVPPPIILERGVTQAYQFVERPGPSSLFGSWQLPLTLHYTHFLAREGLFPLCSGGGLMNSRDALEVIVHGATAVQFATAVLLYGYRRIREIVLGIEDYLEHNSIDDIANLRGLALKYVGSENDISFRTARAEINHQNCSRCDRCLQLTFCTALELVDEHVHVIHNRCDGCGLCTYFCETGAIHLSTTHWAAGHVPDS